MERESCFSLNLSAVSPRQGLANPMADSTRIDRAATTTLTPKHNRLYTLHSGDLEDRGERRISQGQRSNSFCNLNIGSPNKSIGDLNRSTSSTTNARQKLNLSQLDPRTYADVNSTGLASRIAKYHENAGAGRLQRSISVNNLSNPLVRPRRSIASPLPYKPSLPKLSVTQIAPPGRSFYSGNTLASLLRSNSVVGVVHKLGEQPGPEQLSRENRPILHPPPTQQEIEPTRSVLEELKEISRKRINSGETQSPHEMGKKRIASHVQPPQQAVPSPVSFKRQREGPPLTVAVPLRQQHNMPPSLQHLQSNNIVVPTLSTPQQLSPEQQAAKRRICTYNNDIASSLSSSRRHCNKRKLYDMSVNQSYSKTGHELSAVNASCASSSSESSSCEHAAKIQRKAEADTVCKSLSMPIPTTIPVAVPPPRMHSAPTEVDGVPQSISTTVSLPVPPKPKLTLFNAHQKSQSDQQQQLDLDSPEVDADEYASIQFVKPKQQNSMSGGIGKNPVIERMQKTKLAIMLSCLRGEIYVGESEDDHDAPSPKLSTPIKPIAATTTTTITSTTVTPAIRTEATIITKTSETTSNVELKLPSNATTAQVKPILKLDKQITTLTPTPAAATTTAGETAPTTQAAVTTAAPFTFGDLVKGATANKTAATGSNGIGLVGSDLTIKPNTSQTLTPKTTSVSIPTLTFKAASTDQTQIKAPVATMTTPPMFQFDANSVAINTIATKPTPAITTTAITTTATGVSGSNFAPPSTTTATFATPAAATTPSVVTFGQLNKATTNSITTTTTTATSSKNSGFGGFTFSSNIAAPAANASLGGFGNQSNTFDNNFKQPEAATSSATGAATVKPLFGSQSNNSFANAFKSSEPNPSVTTAPTSSASSQETAKGFNFTATATTTASIQPSTTTSTKLFSFGANDTSKPAEPATTTTNMFGQNLFEQKPAAETSTPFAFGAAKTAAPAATPASPPFIFGGAKPPAQAASVSTEKSVPFSFGGTKSVASTPAATTEKSAPFSFGGAKPATNNISNNLYSFGGASVQAPFAATTTNNVSGTVSSSTNAFNFGAVPVQKPASVFGSQASSTGTNATPGATPKPFPFGGAASSATVEQQQQQQTNLDSARGFSFGATLNKTNGESNTASNIFGASTGVVKPSFGFGDNNGSATSNSAPAPTSNFGQFGGAASSGGNQSKPFNFGGNTTASPAPAAALLGGNLFGNAVAATQFGGTSAAPNSNASAKPFNFGTAQTASNVFSSPSPGPAPTKPTAAALQFGAGTSLPAMPTNTQQLNVNNIFALPPSVPENRPFRRATRRLQK